MSKEDNKKVESGTTDSTFLHEEEDLELDGLDEEIELAGDFDFDEEETEEDDGFSFDFLKKENDDELDEIEKSFPKLDKQPDIDVSFQKYVAKHDEPESTIALTEEPNTTPSESTPTKEPVDHYQYLLDEIEGKKTQTTAMEEMTESALNTLKEEELTIREMLTSNRTGIITADEEAPEDYQFDYKTDEEEFDFNLDRVLPNVPLSDTTEYLRIVGIYSEAFKEFITSEEILKNGNLSIAVVLEGEDVIIRNINPEPKSLFILQHVLSSFTITHVRNEEELAFSIFSFLDTATLTL